MTSSYITVAEAVSWIAHKDFAAFGEYYKLRSHKTWKTENPVELLSCLQEMLEERDEEYARTKKPATKALAIAEKLRQLSKLPTSVTKSMENTYEANRKTILVAIKMVEEERSRENAG